MGKAVKMAAMGEAGTSAASPARERALMLGSAAALIAIPHGPNRKHRRKLEAMRRKNLSAERKP